MSNWLENLAQNHYAIVHGVIAPKVLASLRVKALSETYRPARVGRSQANEPMIRNDELSWIEWTDQPELFAALETIREDLNRTLYLGLRDFEAHFARYEKGHYYAKHVDRFSRGTGTERVISVVLYLNENWSVEDGGQLKLYPPNQSHGLEILPEMGTLVCFTSDDIEHEVLPAGRERLSIAAWFRR